MAHWGMLVDLKRCAGCGACVVACQLANGQKPGISWSKLDVCEWGEEVGESGRAYIPHACMHCENAPCVEACPVGATTQRDDGVVLVDYGTCIGCQLCMAACPYDARVFNDVEGNYFGASEQAPYEAYSVQRANVVEKCTFCIDRVDEGLKCACVLNCPGGARYFGDLDDPDSDISKRLAKGDAVRIDQTSLYYVPVDGMPAEYLPTA